MSLWKSASFHKYINYVEISFLSFVWGLCLCCSLSYGNQPVNCHPTTRFSWMNVIFPFSFPKKGKKEKRKTKTKWIPHYCIFNFELNSTLVIFHSIFFRPRLVFYVSFFCHFRKIMFPDRKFFSFLHTFFLSYPSNLHWIQNTELRVTPAKATTRSITSNSGNTIIITSSTRQFPLHFQI